MCMIDFNKYNDLAFQYVVHFESMIYHKKLSYSSEEGEDYR